MSRHRPRLARPVLAVALLGVVALGLTSIALARPGATNDKTFPYAVGLWGDLPYNDVQAQTGVPNLIADLNNADLAFSIHDGDLKAGSGTTGSVTPTTCADDLDSQALGYLNALNRPAMFTPGDNDWTDCDRGSNGGFNSLERLDHERQVFFATPFSQGKEKLKLEVQRDETCLSFAGYVDPTVAKLNDNTTLDLNQTANTRTRPAACVENRRWLYRGVMYVTLNVQGSCNNLCDKDPNPAEETARRAADIAWLKQSFAEAQQQHAAAVMLISQAEPGFDLSDGTRAPLRNPQTLAETDGQPDGFQAFLLAVRDEAIAF